MNRDDRNLLLRAARRLEERAAQNYARAMDPAVATTATMRETAKRTRDAELGDVLDLKQFVAREGTMIVEHSGTFVMVPATPDVDMVAAGAAEVAKGGDDVLSTADAVYRAMVKGAKPL